MPIGWKPWKRTETKAQRYIFGPNYPEGTMDRERAIKIGKAKNKIDSVRANYRPSGLSKMYDDLINTIIGGK
tara:strand:- start:78 stop:293 length:216 start_codon:yes stop_codon:yes gene_type:complete